MLIVLTFYTNENFLINLLWKSFEDSLPQECWEALLSAFIVFGWTKPIWSSVRQNIPESSIGRDDIPAMSLKPYLRGKVFTWQVHQEISHKPSKQTNKQTNLRKYIWSHHHHHYHVVPLARISLTLSRHFSLSFIASDRSSGLHPVSSHSCWMNVRAGRPAFAGHMWGSIWVHHLCARPCFSSSVLHVWYV